MYRPLIHAIVILLSLPVLVIAAEDGKRQGREPATDAPTKPDASDGKKPAGRDNEPAVKDRSPKNVKQPAAIGTTGVVDLDRVAQAVGWDEEIERDVAATRAKLGKQLSSFTRAIAQKVKGHKATIAKAAKLTDEQTEDLQAGRNLRDLPLNAEQRATLLTVLENQQQYVQTVDQHAAQLLRDRRLQLISIYRSAARPVVRTVAEEQGLTVVLTKSDAIFYHAPSADITEAVISEIRKAPPVVTLPPMQEMKLPGVTP